MNKLLKLDAAGGGLGMGIGGSVNPINAAYRAKAMGYAPLAFWPLTVDFNDISGNNFHGTSTAVVIQGGTGKDGRPSAYFNNSGYLDVYSAALAAGFNGNEFCIGGFFRATDAMLVDGNYHDMPIFETDSGDNLFFRSLNGSLGVNRRGNGVTMTWNQMTSGFGNAWRHVMMRCTVAGDSLRVYVDGGQGTPNVTGNGAWGGAMLTTGALWGKSSGAPAGKIHPWWGWMQYVGIWPLLSQPQVTDLSVMV